MQKTKKRGVRLGNGMTKKQVYNYEIDLVVFWKIA